MTGKWKRPILTLMYPTVHQNNKSSRRKLIESSPKLFPGFEEERSFITMSTSSGLCCKFSKRCLFKIVLLFNLACIVGYSMFYRSTSAPTKNFRILNQDVHKFAKLLSLRKCNFPKLKPYDEDIYPHLEVASSINCVHSANPNNPIGEIVFVQERGKRILKQIKEISGTCCYRPFHRDSNLDASETDSKCTQITQKITVIPEEHEFVEVICYGGRSGDYKDGFALIGKKKEVEDRIQNLKETLDENGEPLLSENDGKISVIVLGLDATSRMNFLRMMPKSNSYLLKNLSAIVMEGYTKVAENTLPNVIPLLTGRTLDDFKKRCIDSKLPSSEVHLDDCPFIWKKFATHGFATGFAEDDVSIGIFNMDWERAFVKQPTDYYLRPFSTFMQLEHGSENGQCYGTRLSFKVLLDNLENMAEALANRHYFQMTWATSISHNDINKLKLGDVPLLEFLQFMDKFGHFNNTVLILMSDHGSRVDDVRQTPQGKIEDRMPLFYIVLPPWFATKYPEAVSNLKTNSKRLTSAFDVYETLQDFMDPSRLDNNGTDYEMGMNMNQFEDWSTLRKPRSLFKTISENRNCFDAGIPLHWCVCQSEGTGIKINLDSEEVQGAVKYAIDSMNYHLTGQWDCETLTLDKVTDAFYNTFDPTENELGGNNSTSKKINRIEKLTIIRVSFITSPGEGSFDATMVRSGVGSWMLTEQIVRINEYDGDGDCVEQEFKPFCYCNYMRLK